MRRQFHAAPFPAAWCWWPDGSASPASEYKDWYLFGFGTDYRAALYDYRDVAGPPALLPNYALGPHYSRWFSYADWEEREIVATFARNAIPLSVMQVGGGGCGTQGSHVEHGGASQAPPYRR